MGSFTIATMASAAAMVGLVANPAVADVGRDFSTTLTIQQIDAAHRTFTAGAAGRSQEFAAGDDTHYFRKDHEIGFGDLAVGDRVSVSYPLRQAGRDAVPAEVVQVVTRRVVGDP